VAGRRLTAIIGTAGDRGDEILRQMGQAAAEASDLVLVKETRRYLRGRAGPEEMSAAFVEGITAAGDTPYQVITTEMGALKAALADLQPGDAVAMMCIETGPDARELVESLGGRLKGGTNG
jgi:cyanophycin synthetase